MVGDSVLARFSAAAVFCCLVVAAACELSSAV